MTIQRICGVYVGLVHPTQRNKQGGHLVTNNIMAQGPHVHDWHYNDAEIGADIYRKEVYYTAIRFCKTCKFIEETELTDKE